MQSKFLCLLCLVCALASPIAGIPVGRTPSVTITEVEGLMALVKSSGTRAGSREIGRVQMYALREDEVGLLARETLEQAHIPINSQFAPPLQHTPNSPLRDTVNRADMRPPRDAHESFLSPPQGDVPMMGSVSLKKEAAASAPGASHGEGLPANTPVPPEWQPLSGEGSQNGWRENAGLSGQDELLGNGEPGAVRDSVEVPSTGGTRAVVQGKELSASKKVAIVAGLSALAGVVTYGGMEVVGTPGAVVAEVNDGSIIPPKQADPEGVLAYLEQHPELQDELLASLRESLTPNTALIDKVAAWTPKGSPPVNI